ncbi:hypothetical protein F383_21281 [Gossypium arboreum]|uniref:Uncharacterized protein n=1 Tax=Gossypium arboreum TaxID=29729 RepID=A0A0B0P0T8_GOSAR|nr:hypothetical protein F383_21281 [Gossypium arboreum]
MLVLVESRIKIDFYYISSGLSSYLIVILVVELQHFTHKFNFYIICVDKTQDFMH